MTNCLKFFFSSYKPCAGNCKIKIAKESLSPVANKRTISTLKLQFVFHVPDHSCSLLSVNKLTKHLSCLVKFSASYCEFQDRSSGRMIDSARECEGRYLLEVLSFVDGQAHAFSSLFFS